MKIVGGHKAFQDFYKSGTPGVGVRSCNCTMRLWCEGVARGCCCRALQLWSYGGLGLMWGVLGSEQGCSSFCCPPLLTALVFLTTDTPSHGLPGIMCTAPSTRTGQRPW